jgi:hypothetical protein
MALQRQDWGRAIGAKGFYQQKFIVVRDRVAQDEQIESTFTTMRGCLAESERIDYAVAPLLQQHFACRQQAYVIRNREYAVGHGFQFQGQKKI